jgi:hypothetical protein
MLDPRVYRAGFVPLVLAVVVVAFALSPAPHGAGTSLSAQDFDGRAAAAYVHRWLARPALRDRRPGGPGDAAMAAIVGRDLSRLGFHVRRRTAEGRTVDGRRALTTVLAERPGMAGRALVVAADRSSQAAPGAADLTATGALVELAQVLAGRTLDRSVVLASVSGGPGGAGTAALARQLGAPVDAVIVLGALGGGPDRRPWVVPWSDRSQLAPLTLRRTVEGGLRAEVGRAPGGPSIAQQFGRLAFPLTLGGQGPLLAAGLPAVQVSSAGERGAEGANAVDPTALQSFGRGVLRALTALDGSPPPPAPSRYLVVEGQVLPSWTIRLLTGALFLPLLLGVGDGLARVRRRRGHPGMWLRWALAGAVPFVLAALLARLLGATGLLDATPGAVGAGVPIDASGVAALAGVAVVLVGGWLWLRPLLLRLAGVRGAPDEPGAAAAAALLGLVCGLLLWVANPFAFALVLPGLHLWLLATAPETRPRRGGALALALVGALPGALVALGYGLSFGVGPLHLAWTGLLAVAGGAVGMGAALAWCLVLGTFVAVLAIVARPREGAEAPVPVTVRGPRTYAGPGSLGGTESALRR